MMREKLTDMFGQPVVRARPSRWQGERLDVRNAKARKLSGILAELESPSALNATMNGNAMSGTCGQKFTDLCENADLQSYLESRLVEHPGLTGSQVSEVVWKASDMLVGRPIYQLRALVLRIPDSGCGGRQDFKNWSTPKLSDSNGERVNRTPRRDGIEFSAGLNDQVVKVNWPSPKNNDPNGLSPQGRGYGPALQDAAAWASPTSRDWKDSAGMSLEGTNPDGSVRSRLDQLPRQAMQVAWGTPRTDHGGNPKNLGDGKGRLEDQVFGAMLNGENAKEENIVQFRLNPAFSLWLMGYPPQWMATAPSAEGVRYKVREMRLCRR